MAPSEMCDSDDELFTRSPLITKYNSASNDNENQLKEMEPREMESQAVKAKKNKVPANITCHCAGNL